MSYITQQTKNIILASNAGFCYGVKRAVETTLSMTTIASTEGYYISIDSLELENNKAIGLNETIKHYEKKEVSLSFDQCKDLSFISKLPVYMDARLDPASVVLNMILRLSNLNPVTNEDEGMV